MYQTEWQNIQFSDIAKLSSTRLAGPEFYRTFYEEFFRRYQNWDQLSASWRTEKQRYAEFVLERAKRGSSILSVGCGLGAMERYIRAQAPDVALFIHDVTPSAWHWIGPEFAPERKFVGMIPDCLPGGIQFDLVYLSSVDYALDNERLVSMLTSLRPYLSDAVRGEHRLLIFGSLQDTSPIPAGKGLSLLRGCKALAAGLLNALGLHARGQFWGWTRTQREYQSLMTQAGYRDIQDGFIDLPTLRRYWIAGR
jgi:SAM-dependent methyltransferase